MCGRLSDVVLRACDLSNADGREGSLRRVEIDGSRLVGFGLTGGTVQDLRVVDSSLALASLAFSKLRAVVFERVDLAEASFMDAQLESHIHRLQACWHGLPRGQAEGVRDPRNVA